MPDAPTPVPPPQRLYQLGIGHYFSRALALATKLGVADALADGPRDAAALAAATGTHAPALQRVLRLLVSAGVFDEPTPGTFALTDTGTLLRRDVPFSMRAAVLLFAGVPMQDAWRELEYCVRTGEPFFRQDTPDGDAFDALARNPEQAAVFDEAMAAFTRQIALAVAASYDFTGLRRIADVGGGTGALLLGILGAHPHLEGIVFDRPAAAASARAAIAGAGLDGRCAAVEGDFFHAVPPGCDAYLLKHVIHDWDDTRAGAILSTCRAAMPPGAKLLIVEGLYPARVASDEASRGATANDVNMLVCTGGRQRSEAEFRALYDAAGLRLTRIVPTPAPVCVIEGVAAAG